MVFIKNKNLKEEFDLLVKEIWQIELQWKTYKQLYGDSQKEVDVLNQTTPLTFKVFQNALYDSILLSIHRILDQKNTYDNINLSIDKILEIINKIDKEKLYNKFDNSYEKIKKKAINIKILKHKRIDHNDLVIKKANCEKLSGITRKEISEILENIYDWMNEISKEFYKGKIEFGNVPVANKNTILEKLKNQ